MYHEGKGCRYQLVLLLLILRCLIIQFYHSVAIYQVKNIFLLIMHQNFEVKLIYHYCISIKHCGDKITGDVFFHKILLKFPHTFHTILMLCTLRYIFHTIRYVSCTIRYVLSSIPESHASDALFMCSSAFQDLYHLWLLLIIVCVQNAKSSKHVIDIKLEINKKTLLSSFLGYI